MTLRLAIFDCDGTLVDSQADIGAAMDGAFHALGLVPPPRSETRRIVGLSLVEAMRRLHTRGDHDTHLALAEAYKAAFRARREAGMVGEPLYEGIAGLVEDLAARGWLLGVATGKSDRGWPIASPPMASRAISSPSRPPTATRPSRIRA
jgi:phosphoglycolate phosphatase